VSDTGAKVRQLPAREELDDATLVARAVAGERWAEETLFRRHVRGVWRVALRMVGNPADAEDVVQDTFATVLQSLGSMRDGQALRAWLLQVAVRHAHRRLRRRRLRRFLGLDEGVPEAVLAEAPGATGARPEARAELHLVEEALAKMPPAERIAWVLRHVEGEALEDVARACGCSLATVKRRIAAAEARLAVHLNDEEASRD
jgi:RNA polymerase sigma-70 factor (ECF subfamily)